MSGAIMSIENITITKYYILTYAQTYKTYRLITVQQQNQLQAIRLSLVTICSIECNTLIISFPLKFFIMLAPVVRFVNIKNFTGRQQTVSKAIDRTNRRKVYCANERKP